MIVNSGLCYHLIVVIKLNTIYPGLYLFTKLNFLSTSQLTRYIKIKKIFWFNRKEDTPKNIMQTLLYTQPGEERGRLRNLPGVGSRIRYDTVFFMNHRGHRDHREFQALLSGLNLW